MDSPAAIIAALVLALAQSLPAIADTRVGPDGGYSIDTSERTAVSLFHKTVFRSSDGVDSGWSGDIDSCDAGDTSAAYKSAVLRRINWFRAMAGVPADVELDPELNAKAQQAALLMAANGSLSHSPPSHWTCYGSDADEAAGRSNLSLGRAGADAVTFGYMEDPGTSNSAVGHRRWLLYPQTLRMGTGDVHGSMRSNALWVLSSPFNASRPPVRDEFVAWPPPGHVPFDVVFPRWSISYPEADFSDASVSMTSNGDPVPVQLETVHDGYGENTLVWFADGYEDRDRWARPSADTEYEVTVDNVTVEDEPRSFSYSVTVFDPDQNVEGPAVITDLGTQEDASSLVFQTSQTEGALQYQWRQAMLSPFELHDTADDGLTNFIVSQNTGYQAHIGADGQGDSFFRLAHPSGRDRAIPEALELHGELLPGPSAQLQFESRMGWSTSSQVAAVEVSADGGLSWQSVHEQVGDRNLESTFSEKSLSLAAWQGRTVRLRFHYIKKECAGCSYYPYSGQAGLWEIDDIQISGVETVSEPTESSPLSGREISFSPVQAGRQLLQSRAGMYGNFSDWSSAHVLTVAESDLQPGANPDVVFAPPSGTVEPTPPNEPPEVAISGSDRTLGDSDGLPGESVMLQATAADSDGSIASSEWLIDGTVVATSLSATLELPDGETTVTFRATDDQGDVSTSSVTITVAAFEGDRQALDALYSAAGGDQWHDNSGWLGEPGSECDWYGVECTDDHVTGLALGDNELSGQIPAALGQLSQLESLRLSGNQLIGTIPPSLGELSALRWIDLRGNQLSGEIPHQLGQLSALRHFNLGDNKLSGAIPSWLEDLTLLISLHLSGNQFTGQIPAGLGQLSELRSLELSENRLTGEIPAELGQLSLLRYLVLNGNQLSGEIPSMLVQLESLKELFLQDNQLTGVLPEGLDQLPNLTDIDVSDNSMGIPGDDVWPGLFNGVAPDSALELAYNNIGIVDQATTKVYSCVRFMENGQQSELDGSERMGIIFNILPTEGVSLQVQEVRAFNPGNFLTDSLEPPDCSGDFELNTGVYSDFLESDGVVFRTEFDLIDQAQLIFRLRDAREVLSPERADRKVLEALYSATGGDQWKDNSGWLGEPGSECDWYGVECTDDRVTRLALNDNGLSGQIPAALGQLDQLVQLRLERNQLTGEIPAELGQLSQLALVFLYGNQLTGRIPAELGNLTGLVALGLQFNQLSGEVPQQLEQLSELQSFSLSDNQLTGTIPSWIGELPALRSLGLSRNQFTGHIPAALGQLVQLQSLWLSGNQLSGQIPQQLGQLSALRHLGLDGNELSGAIPPWLGQLSQLDRLNLSNNQFMGDIPAELGQLGQLRRLELFDNELTGEIPSTLLQLESLEGLFLQNNQLAGEVPAGLDQLPNLTDFDVSGNPFGMPDDEIWPGPFNGVTPDPALDLPFNNIGLLDRSTDRVYSCVRFLMNGQQSQLDGFERMDITFDVLQGEELTLQVLEVRAFNPDNALNESSELPDCSGTFELSTQVYSDTIERDGAVFHDEFDLVDGAQLIFELRDSLEVLLQ